MIRYWQDEEQTKAVTRIDEEDGQPWMCTGDKGVMDDEGYVRSERYAPLFFRPGYADPGGTW